MKKQASSQHDLERSRIMLNLLESVQRDGDGSQRARASEFGIALGLVNAYLNYCVKKGYVRIKKIPAKRYFYCLTPRGFAEKSRLALVLVSNSFRSFRQARTEYGAAFASCKRAGANRMVLMGCSELAEIAILCAAENDLVIVAIVADSEGRFLGVPVVTALDQVPDGFDAIAITDLEDPAKAYALARATPNTLLLTPSILGINRQEAAE